MREAPNASAPRPDVGGPSAATATEGCTRVQLTLAAPRNLEEALVDQLLAHPDWAEGFTLLHAEGHSQRAESLTVQERVRGRADRISLQIVLTPAQAQALLAHLKRHLPRPEVAYWLSPVIDFGRLA